MSVRILVGDCRDRLKELPDESVHCVVTSPPYWGLRDYGIPPTIWGGNDACDHEWIERGVVVQSGGTGEASAKQVTNAGTQGSVQKPIKTGFCKWCAAWRGSFGLEPTYQLFVDHAVEVFAELRRVLKRDGTLWLNLGDSYASGEIGRHDGGRTFQDTYDRKSFGERKQARRPAGIKPKNLVGIPWRVAFALQADGWWLRQDIIWSKPNPMPESVTDRCTKAHEYLFLLSKSERYWFDQDAIAEPVSTSSGGGRAIGRNIYGSSRARGGDRSYSGGFPNEGTRNKRSVWEVTTQPFSEAHFATYPPALIEPCILAGCPEGGTVLDPFGGAGTTGLVADRLKRDAILIELNPAYAEMAERRIRGDAALFSEVAMEAVA